MRPAFERGLVITLGVGAVALAATYYARRAPEWDPAKRVVVAIGLLGIAGIVVLADWLVQREARDRRKR